MIYASPEDTFETIDTLELLNKAENKKVCFSTLQLLEL